MIDPADFSLMMLSEDRRLDLVAAAVASIDPLFMGTDTVLRLLDSMAPSNASSIEDVLAHAFGTLGFQGNRERYYAPSNSLIDRVLIRRLGNPLSLAVITSELARRSGFELDVVGIPGHVVLGDPSAERWFDPFAGGGELDRSGLEALHARLFPDASFDERTLRPLTPPNVAARILQNLRVAAHKRGDRNQLADLLRLRSRIPGAPVEDRVDLANVLMLVGRWEEAAGEHDRLAELRPHKETIHQRAAARCRSHLN